MRQCIALFLLVFSFNLSAQYRQLSAEAEISIITIGPGANFNDCFGHSAFRVLDPRLGIDLAYNYGTFNTEEPGFYGRFALGVQDYYLAAYDFTLFFDNYQAQDRWIKEQILNLSIEEVQHIYEYMENDRKPENRAYRYDPYFNNCATKMRDLVVDALGDNITFDSSHLTEESSLRGLTHKYDFNHPWWGLGVDLALGTIMDKQASPDEYMFLPDYVHAAYQSATISRDGMQVPAVKFDRTLFQSDAYQTPEQLIRPWMIFSLVALVVMLFTYRDYVKNRRSRWLDFVLMFLTGLMGLILLLLWFVTSHSTTSNNLNILWAFLPNLAVAFMLLKKNPPAWVKSYVRFLVVLLLALAFVWLLGIQVYTTSMIPIFAFLTVRYVFLWRRGLVESRSIF